LAAINPVPAFQVFENSEVIFTIPFLRVPISISADMEDRLTPTRSKDEKKFEWKISYDL
jgi:hypothetical protein